MPKQKQTIGDEQRRFLRRQARDAICHQPGLRELKRRLLAVGGEEVCFAYIEDDLSKILGHGQAFSGGRRARVMRGAPSCCHSNSARLYEANPGKLLIATGYGLSDDGIWRQHSWCVLAGPGQTHLVETTRRRTAYYGFILTEQEARQFCVDNE
jgi:hypothetical protein